MGEYDFLHFPAESVHVDPQIFASLPESARTLFAAVRDHGPVTNAALRTLTGMPARTIRYAAKRLKDEQLIDMRCSLKDCRTCYFFVDRRCVGIEALEAARVAAKAAAARGKVVEPA